MNREAIWLDLGGSGNPTALQLFRAIAANLNYDPQYFSLSGWLDILRAAAADPDATFRERIRIKRIVVDLLRVARKENQ
jgi:hypothetical protein